MGSRERTGFRSLADQLRSWPEDRLSRLLTARPDLVTPVPHDLGQLASRATVRASISRALDILSRPELSVLDALVVARQTPPARLRELVRARPGTVDDAVERLLDLALAWESGDGLRALSGVADALVGGPEAGVSGLRPCSPDAPSLERVRVLVEELTPEGRALLEHVADRGGEATTGSARRTVLPADAASPAEELLARRLLVPQADDRAVVPGEVGLVLRGGRTTTEPVDEPPVVAIGERGQALVDRAAAGAALEAVRRVETLLDRWGTAPASELRSGGLGVRELRAAAAHLQVSERDTAVLVETAAAAGLVGDRADGDGNPVWVPTDAYDDWLDAAPARRWSRLARAWLDVERVPALAGTRDTAGTVRACLAPDLGRPGAAEARRTALALLAELPEGEVLAAGTGPPSLVAAVGFRRPRRPRGRADQVVWAVEEAGLLGLTGLGGASTPLRALVAGDVDGALAAMESLLPEPVDHVLVQADLTAVAPGPLESRLARDLALVADVESQGAATVYRFTGGSVRRALDAGWSSAEVHAFVESVSRTPVPQPLRYLVDDTARTFGTLRVGPAEAFLRSEDETALTALLHHPRAASLGLRRIAPTVLVSSAPVDLLLARLRDLGSAPVVEAADGTVRVGRPEPWRARVPRERREPPAGVRTTVQVAAALRTLRAGEEATASRSPGGPPPPPTPSGALATLREAAETGSTVTIGYLDDRGGVAERTVDPLLVEGGHLTARDHRTELVRTFAVHRITTVREKTS